MIHEPSDRRQSPGPTRCKAAIYTRISHAADPAVSTERQEFECRSLATALGVTVTDVYSDADHSAYSGRRRPEFERLLRDIEAGAVTMVIAWHPDRVYRRAEDLISFVDVVSRARAAVATVASGILDLTTADGRVIARLVGAAALHESERQAERIQLKHQQLAEQGRWGGGVRPYGYRSANDGALEVVPHEAEVIVEAADRILNGETPHYIAKDLNRRGIPAAKGGQWSPSSIRSLLTRRSLAGHRVRHGEIVGRARWEPILDLGTIEQIDLVLRNSPGRRRRPSRTVLLSASIIRCGRCGGPLISEVDSRRKARLYNCCSSGCRRTSVVAEKAERTVVEAIAQRLADPSVPISGAAALSTRQLRNLARRLTLAEAQLNELAVTHASGTLPARDWLSARKPLLREIADSRKQLEHEQHHAVLRSLPRSPEDMISELYRWPLARRQAFVSAAVERITVRPPRQPSGKFDEWRVLDGIAWRQ